MSERTYTIPVSEDNLRQMLMLGATKLCPDGSYEITPKLQAWLREWCDLRIPPNLRKEEGNDPQS